MGGNGLDLLQRAAILQIGRDPGRPEGVVADCRGDARLARPALHQIEGVALQERPARQGACAADGGTKRRRALLRAAATYSCSQASRL